MPESPDHVADAKDRLRLAVALALRTVARIDHTTRGVASSLRGRRLLPTRDDVLRLRSSITDLTRAVRDLDRS